MKKNCSTIENNKNFTATSNIQSLRNPNVNALLKILPANINKKTVSKAITEDSSKVNENTYSNDLTKTSTNETNAVLHNSDMVCNEEHILHENNFSKTAITENVDENIENVQHDEFINSKGSKLSKKSDVVQELPPLRKTTPRLAKTRSAQNMKLMAQVLGSKGLSSNYNTLKTKEKSELDKNLEKVLSLPKIVGKSISYYT